MRRWRPSGSRRPRRGPGAAGVRDPRRAHAGDHRLRARARGARPSRRDPTRRRRPRRCTRRSRELRRALDEIRGVLANLSPAEPGTAQPIEDLLKSVLERWRLPATWSVEGDLARGPRVGAGGRVLGDPRGHRERGQARGCGRGRGPGPRVGSLGRGQRRGPRPRLRELAERAATTATWAWTCCVGGSPTSTERSTSSRRRARERGSSRGCPVTEKE